MFPSTLFNDRRVFAAGVAFISIFLLLSLSANYHLYSSARSDVVTQIPEKKALLLSNATDDEKPYCISHNAVGSSAQGVAYKNPEGGEKLAYVTWLSGTVIKDGDEDLEHDNYFLATRILIWQLLHVPETRTKGIDVVVMVTPSVSESRRARLRQDGAIVHSIEFLHSDSHWEKGEHDRWNDIMSKLRVFEMTQYSRVLLLDGDTTLLHPLDGVFDDPASHPRNTSWDIDHDHYPISKENPTHWTDLEGVDLPETYLLASLSENRDSNHVFPPTYTNGIKTPGYFNAGFFMLAPSIAMFDYYVALLNKPHSFDSQYMEQNLLNTAHHWDGPMAWKELDYKWNIREPNENDFAHGLVSVHEKWWTQPWIYDNEKVKAWLQSRRWVMKGWYDVYDLLTRKGAAYC